MTQDKGARTGHELAHGYLHDPRHTNGSPMGPRYIMDEHFQRARDDAVALARECFLNMLADATRFDEDVDGDEVNGRGVVYVDYHITTSESQFRELVDALGIKVSWTETTKEAVDRAIAEPAVALADAPCPPMNPPAAPRSLT